MDLRYRAYCDDCLWESVDSWLEEDNAFEDLNQHMQFAHSALCGVRKEAD